MSVMGPLAAFTLKSAFNTSVDQLLGWIGTRFSNPSQPLQRAMMRASDNAWKALGFALVGDELFERVKPWFPDRDLNGVRGPVRGFLGHTPTGLNAAPAGVRLQACAELTRLRRAGRLTLLVDRNVIVVDLWRCGDPTRLLPGAEEAVARVADALATEAPNLARVIQLAPANGLPLLAAAFLYFFRREVEVNPDLARGLSFDSMRMVTAASERGILFLEGPPPGVLDHFDMLFDPFADWFGRAVHELATFRKELRDWRETHRVLVAATDAPLEILAFNERERMLTFQARLRQLPGELVEWSDWQNLGDNLDACGLFKEARAAHTAAATQAHTDANVAAEAENYYRIYKDACESGKWPEAKEALTRATKLDPVKFRPFDTARYQLDAVLGVSAFGTMFRCLDTEDLDDHGNPTPVVIKSLRHQSLDRDLRAVMADARTLRDLHRPGSRIIRTLGWGYARGDTENISRKERPYLVTEFFPGETLDVVIRRYGPMPVQVFLLVAMQIAEALRKAHSKNVIHRDVTPANVMSRMVENNWDVRVIDFGLAAPHEVVYHASLNLAAKRSTVRDRSLMRSLEFASPEQRGKLPGIAVGPHSDVYSFGKTCLWLLFQTTHPLPHHWASIPESIRARLQALLERATADTLDVRYPSFAPVIEALKAFFPGAEPPAAPMAEAVEVPRTEVVPEPVTPPQAVAKPEPPVAHDPLGDLESPVEELHELEPVQESHGLEPVEELHELEPVEELHELEPVEELEPSETVEELKAVETPNGLQSVAESEHHEEPEILEPAETHPTPERLETREVVAPTEPSVVEPSESPAAVATVTDKEPEPKSRDTRGNDPLHLARTRVAGEQFTIKLPGNLPLTFAWCPPGTFTMGSDRHDANSDEKPTHSVTLTQGFFIGIFPVTQAQWKAALMGPNPSHFEGPDRPVEQVLWEEGQKFCRQMSRQLKGRATVRLPTEAEWEYACRAGTSSEFNTGDGEEQLQKAGWYEENSGRETHPVGQLAPNAWGVYDMHGNVWEWCSDWYAEYTPDERIDPTGAESATDRVFRGGGWGDSAKFCRSTYRSWFDPAVRYDALGFRIVLVPAT
ncbi:MAG: hypothetical protein C0467_20180 [Planctomycetaceae bacterium]|nr:hypothetical protein [Planctomycetaceae bacterium]